MSFLSNLFSGGAITIVDSVGKVLDNVVTTKGEKMQLDNEMRKSELQFQVDMKKLSNEEQQMILGDISSARQREVQVLNSEYATQLAKNVAPYLALGTMVITLGLFYFLIFSTQEIPSQKKISFYMFWAFLVQSSPRFTVIISVHQQEVPLNQKPLQIFRKNNCPICIEKPVFEIRNGLFISN